MSPDPVPSFAFRRTFGGWVNMATGFPCRVMVMFSPCSARSTSLVTDLTKSAIPTSTKELY